MSHMEIEPSHVLFLISEMLKSHQRTASAGGRWHGLLLK
jgi:hypothetical protein